ncbi:MAG: hypothetical protein ACTHK5_00690 [Tsuneonella sp.]
MMDLIETNWQLFLIAVVAAVVLLWFLLVRSRRTRVEIDRRDTLDEGAAPAARNQALIDAPPAARVDAGPIPPTTPYGLAGTGTAVAAAVEEAQIEAEERTHAGEADDLTRIKGLGPKLAATLHDLGVTRFDQIAGWSDADIDRIDAQLGRFQGRIRRDGWVEQAGYLAAGDVEGFKARFGAV